MEYNKSLDGIRGLAVLMVFAFHLGMFSGGWVGVQIFFVLSGYLITGILRETRKFELGYYLKRFYWRRTLRIFPIYYLLLIVTAALYFAVGSPAAFGNDWKYLFTYTHNFARLRPEDVGLFVHVWSLAVEEQFYLVWPFALYFLSYRKLKVLLILLVILTPVFRYLIGEAILDDYGPAYIGRVVYSLPFSHADAFAVGGILAIFDIEKLKRQVYLVFFAVSGFVFIIGASHFFILHLQGGADWTHLGYPHLFVHNLQFVWGYTLINLFSAALILICLKQNILKSCLSLGPLVYIGKISYGVYLYHIPIIMVLKGLVEAWEIELGIIQFGVLAIVMTLLISSASFKYLERPILRLKSLV